MKKRDKGSKTSKSKREYRAPELKIHGDIRTLTRMSKGDTKQDGPGKPSTRLSTGPA